MKGVTVVFCASKPGEGSVIVGWYKNADAYRTVQKDDKGNLYSFEAAGENCVLLTEDQRQFSVPRNQEGGFGRFNVWYADNDESKAFVSKVIDYIADNRTQPVAGDSSKQLLTEEYVENGRGRTATVNVYERNSKAREECLRIRGHRCLVCDFDSGEKYGPEFSNRIEVHHIVPISETHESYKINPAEDLIPVCPNCHAMLHVKINGRELKWEELKERYSRYILP